ncbi:MAG: transporter related protein [bacterium]|nr:transporter related protein [bacterium]
MADIMIHVEQLRKDYGSGRYAVDGISFDVRAGEVLGFLGPNGAGKTTTMKILTSFLAPSSGRAEIAGHDVYGDSLAVRQRIGYLPEDTPLYRDMTVLEYLEFVCDVRDVPRESRRGRLRKVVEQCALGDHLGALIGELSKGFRQRVGLAQAIVHEPEVLILDEPTSGLDPNQIAEIRGVIKSIGREKTVIFSTHILGEVQATCSRVIIISDGKLVADGTPDDLTRKSSGGGSILLEIGGSRGNDTDPLGLLRHIDGIEEIKALSTSGWSLSDRPRATQFRIVVKPGADPRGDIARVISTASGMDLLQMTPETASLEDVFRKLTTTQGA